MTAPTPEPASDPGRAPESGSAPESKPVSDDVVDRMVAARSAIEERIVAAGGRIGDGPGSVRVLAVSKTHSARLAQAAATAGFTDLGESYANELRAKAAGVTTAVRWHFIGQLQTNKVRAVAPHVSVYQSVDRPSLVAELAKRVPGATVMIQVDLAGVAGRGGATWQDAPGVIDAARSAGLDVVGVMGVAPLDTDSVVAASFRRLRALADAESLAECSMGMSSDLELAVAEGSTMVRVGTAIFGSRTA